MTTCLLLAIEVKETSCRKSSIIFSFNASDIVFLPSTNGIESLNSFKQSSHNPDAVPQV